VQLLGLFAGYATARRAVKLAAFLHHPKGPAQMHAELLRLPSAPPPSQPGIERLIGELTADATAAMLQGLVEVADGGLTKKTKELGGSTVAELYQFRQFACPLSMDFDAVAKVQGTLVLKARLSKVTKVPPTDAQLSEWIGWTLGVLDQVLKARLH
jgi:hypothetical protein